MRYEFDITPIGKPRQTRRDKWNPSEATLRYRAFADELRLKANLKRFTLPDSFGVVFHLPMPQSWSNKKREQMRGRPHQQKPDFDNLAKALCDALRAEDAPIWDVSIRKLWADAGSIVIYTQGDYDQT